MPTLLRKRRRALTVLAQSPQGCTEAIMQAHGFPVVLLAGLVRDGLATATTERTFAGKKPMEVTQMRITEAGRQALAGDG